jgi:hypothetical protein
MGAAKCGWAALRENAATARWPTTTYEGEVPGNPNWFPIQELLAWTAPREARRIELVRSWKGQRFAAGAAGQCKGGPVDTGAAGPVSASRARTQVPGLPIRQLGAGEQARGCRVD